MSDYFPVYVYFVVVTLITVAVALVSGIIRPNRASKVKFMPYESGMQTETHLQQERFPLHHYLVALIFLVFDVEVIFLYPWAVIGKQLGPFAFYEMLFFMLVLLVGYIYVWRKGGLAWE